MSSGGRFILPKDDSETTSAAAKALDDGTNSVFICGAHWFTNIDHKQRHDKLDLCKKYNATDYPKYDNYNAINVNKTSDIPEDYMDIMGVPITFLDKYCPEQFEIIGLMSGGTGDGLINGNDGRPKFYVGGDGVYARILIKRKS